MHANSPTRILFVEDHADTAKVCSRLLRGRGYDITCASSVASALASLASEQFDLLICDISLPDGSGLQISKHAPNIPAIAMSGYGSTGDIDASRAAGFCEHLLKPITLQNLIDAIDRGFGRSFKQVDHNTSG